MSNIFHMLLTCLAGCCFKKLILSVKSQVSGDKSVTSFSDKFFTTEPKTKPLHIAMKRLHIPFALFQLGILEGHRSLLGRGERMHGRFHASAIIYRRCIVD